MNFLKKLKEFFSYWTITEIRFRREVVEMHKASAELEAGLIAAEAFVTEENAKRILETLGTIKESCNVHWASDDAQITENKKVAWENRRRMWEEYKADLQARKRSDMFELQEGAALELGSALVSRINRYLAMMHADISNINKMPASDSVHDFLRSCLESGIRQYIRGLGGYPVPSLAEIELARTVFFKDSEEVLK